MGAKTRVTLSQLRRLYARIHTAIPNVKLPQATNS